MISTSVSKLKGNLGETQPPLCKKKIYIYIFIYSCANKDRLVKIMVNRVPFAA